MKIELNTPTLALPRDGLIALRDAEGTRVTTLRGALWITQDSHQSDVILEQGQSFTVDRAGADPGDGAHACLAPAARAPRERRSAHRRLVIALVARQPAGGVLAWNG